MSRLPNPFDGDVSDDSIKDWLRQFEEADLPVILKLLAAFKYYSSRKVSRLVKDLHGSVLSCLDPPKTSLWFVPVGYVAKSGSIIAYYFRTQNSLPQDRFVAPSDLSSLELTHDAAVVFLDDFVGSGNQASQVWRNVVLPAASDKPKCSFVYATLVGYKSGLDKLKASTGFLPVCVQVFTDDARPFALGSSLFDDDAGRDAARKIAAKYGQRLYPNHPLGYKNSQGLLGFFYSTPNNTLPIFWSAQAGWKPLLAHGESYRDPAFLIGPPPGLTRESAPDSLRRPLAEGEELAKYDIEPEVATKIFSEFRKAAIFLVLAPVLRELNIGDGVFSDLLKLITELKYFEHEKEAVCSALLIVADDTPEERIGIKFVAAESKVTTKSIQEILSLANLVNGYRGAVVLRAGGAVIGNCLYSRDAASPSLFLPASYHLAASASRTTGGLLFLFTGRGRIAVFHAGHRILSHRGASWHLHTTELDRGIRSLSTRHGIDVPVLEEVFRLALSLSDAGKGALITLGDHEHVLALSDPPKTEHLKWQEMLLGETPDDATLGLMSQDGATIISGNGQVVQGMTVLRPPPGTVVEDEVGRGSKHGTAARISKVTEAICIAVSVDGRITVYYGGKILFKIMG